MTALTYKPLLSLFSTGSCRDGDQQSGRLLTGIAHPSDDASQWIISQRLLDVRATLSSDGEAVAALLATEPEVRAPWANIAAARCKEAGQLNDDGVLVQLISHLAGAAAWVEAASETETLAPTGQSTMERELLGVAAEQAQATPVLCRVLSAASRLVAWQDDPLPALRTVDASGIKTDQNWCRGRLIATPQFTSGSTDFILAGQWAADGTKTAMDWVLARPWVFLLAAIGYVQDAWTAEGQGGLLLELPAGQHPHQPSEVQVLVAGRDGGEVLCGTLGGFALKILSRLNMGLFPATLPEADINNRLSPLIGELMQRKIWRYHEGLSGEQGFYQLHPDFSDACYQIVGARSFDLHGRELRRAIREQAEQWRIDRQHRAEREGMAA